MLPRPAPLLLALLLLPGAWAAGVSGDLRFPEGAALHGEVEVSAAEGAFDLAPAVRAGRPLSLRVASAEGYLVSERHEHRGGETVGVFGGAPETRNRSVTLPAGVLSNLTCGGQCRVLLVAEGPATLGLAGRAAGPVGVATEPRLYARGATGGPSEDAFRYRVEAGWTVASPRPLAEGPALVLAGGTPRAEGRLALVLLDASAEFLDDGGATRRLSARTTTGADAGPAGIPLARQVTFRHLVLHLDDARLAAPPGAEAVLLAPAPDLRVAGTLRAPRAEGVLVVDGARHDLAGRSLDLSGDLHARPGGDPPSVGAISSATGVPLRGPLEGEASRLLVGGREVPLAPAPAPASAVAVGVSLLGLLAALVALKAGAATPLYLRVTRTHLLRNDNRRLVYETVRARPGVTVAELVRVTGLAEMVVRHHVRMLEAHRHLVLRGTGKVRGCFALDGAVDPQDATLHLILKDPTRRHLARLLAQAPQPLTQSELAEAAGISRRLVSHHLARLEEAGLVGSTGSVPRVYAAMPRLGGLLATAVRA